MRFLDLFSGIGGFALGLERAGHETVAFCEIEPYCRAVLRKHWPNVPIYEDVRSLTAERLAADGIAPDGICGGFPCQDISVAGKGAGIEGSQSGLWSEYARLIGELRPRFAVVENVAALLRRGISRVLGDLAEIGYDAEWHVISAADIGAPHLRERIWIVAYPISPDGWREPRVSRLIDREGRRPNLSEQESLQPENWQARPTHTQSNGEAMADSGRPERHGRSGGTWWWRREPQQALRDARLRGRKEDDVWHPECELGRVAYGIPNNMDRLGALGNAVVPQIPEIIGRALMSNT